MPVDSRAVRVWAGGTATGTARGISATASGPGTVTVATYTAKPVSQPAPNETGSYVDVYLIRGHSLSRVTTVNRGLNGGDASPLVDRDIPGAGFEPESRRGNGVRHHHRG